MTSSLLRYVDPVRQNLVACPTEAEYKARWLELPRDLSPFESAFCAGLIADRLSWVFIAAYQAAQRDCFDGLPADQWICFAVSEDRSGKLAGTKLDESNCLTGTKTWIASSRQVDLIIASIGPTVDQGFVAIPSRQTGVTLTHRDAPAFLPDMSQGSATFERVPIDESAHIRIKGDFGLAEPFFVMTAAAGFLMRQDPESDGEGQDAATRCLTQLESLHRQGYQQDLDALVAVQERISAMGKRAASIARDSTANRDWASNGRLLGMYGKGLRERATLRHSHGA